MNIRQKRKQTDKAIAKRNHLPDHCRELVNQITLAGHEAGRTGETMAVVHKRGPGGIGFYSAMPAMEAEHGDGDHLIVAWIEHNGRLVLPMGKRRERKGAAV